MNQRLSAKGSMNDWIQNSLTALQQIGFSDIDFKQDTLVILAKNDSTYFRLTFQQDENKVFILLDGDEGTIATYKKIITGIFLNQPKKASDSASPTTKVADVNSSTPENKKTQEATSQSKEKCDPSDIYSSTHTECPLTIEQAKDQNKILSSLNHWYYNNWFIGAMLIIGSFFSWFLIGIPFLVVGIIFLSKKGGLEKKVLEIDYSQYLSAISKIDQLNHEIKNKEKTKADFIEQAKSKADSEFKNLRHKNESILIEQQSKLHAINLKIKEQSKKILDPLRIVYYPQNVLCLDTETTGLLESDEILQLSIIDWNENIIYDEMFKPNKKASWDEASEINGIYPDDVKSSPSFLSRIKLIESLLNKADILIGYNIEFDLNMLRNNGLSIDLEKSMVIDVMTPATEAYGTCSNHYKNKKYVKLISAISRSKTKKPDSGIFHNSLYDSICTLRLYKKLNQLNHIPDNNFIKVQ